MEPGEATVIERSKAKTVVSALGAGTLVALGVWILSLEPASMESLRRFGRPTVVRGLAMAGIVFFGLVGVLWFKKLFDKAQKLMSENRRTGGAKARNRHGFLLRGLLKCAACGTAMVSHTVRRFGLSA